jgi:hypothetical protein
MYQTYFLVMELPRENEPYRYKVHKNCKGWWRTPFNFFLLKKKGLTNLHELTILDVLGFTSRSRILQVPPVCQNNDAWKGRAELTASYNKMRLSFQSKPNQLFNSLRNSHLHGMVHVGGLWDTLQKIKDTWTHLPTLKWMAIFTLLSGCQVSRMEVFLSSMTYLYQY